MAGKKFEKMAGKKFGGKIGLDNDSKKQMHSRWWCDLWPNDDTFSRNFEHFSSSYALIIQKWPQSGHKVAKSGQKVAKSGQKVAKKVAQKWPKSGKFG